MRPVVGLLAFLAGLLWVGEAAAAAPVKAFVSIAPQKYFVERIGGDRVEVSVLAAAYRAGVPCFCPSPGDSTIGMNIAGAGLACWSSWMIAFVPFIVLEAVWCLVAVAALAKRVCTPQAQAS